MYSRILVPVDGSEPSQCGLREAIAIARDNRSTLVLLHVVTVLPMPSADAGFVYYGEMLDEMQRAGKELVDKSTRQVAQAGVACESEVIDGGAGPVCDVIVAQAVARHCELIVMGTHGRRGMKRLALGSDAELVVRHAPVPVLLVKSTDAAA